MKSASRLLAAALLTCVLTRLVFILFPAVPLQVKALNSIADAPEYDRLAANLARHHVFSRDTTPPYRPELFRTPGYPLLLAPLYVAFRDPLVWALVLQIVLSLAIVLAARRFALELGLDRTRADLAGLLVGLSPNLAFVATRLVTETFFTLLLLVCLILLNRFRTTRRNSDLVGAGIAAGLLILVRPIATYFPLVLAVYVLLLPTRGLWRRLVSALVPLACASVVVLPWVVRNGMVSGRYVVSTVSERSIYLYTAATVVAAEKDIPLTQARDSMMAEAEARFGPLDSNDEASFWRALSRVAWQRVLAQPVLTAKALLVGAIGNYVVPIGVGPLLLHSGAGLGDNPHAMQETARQLMQGRILGSLRAAWQDRLRLLPPFALVTLVIAALFHIVLMAAAAVTLLRRRGRPLVWLLVPILYFTLLTGPVGEARFRAPVEPLLAIFAAMALAKQTAELPGSRPLNTQP